MKEETGWSVDPVDLRSVSLEKRREQRMRVERRSLRIFEIQRFEGNLLLFTHESVQSPVVVVECEGEGFAPVAQHDGVQPGLCLRRDESKGEEVADIQQGNKIILLFSSIAQ
jgi:hypothetical protein